MKLLILQIVIFGLATAAFADESQLFLITTNQAAEVKQKLDAYENGKLTLQDLNENAGTEGCRELIGYYLLHTNEISAKSILPVSRAYAFGGMYPEAAQLARQYVNVYSNDWHGWRVLGGACLLTKSYNESISAYKNAVRLGDRDSYQPLGLAAIKVNQPEVIGEIVPDLMASKNAKETSEKDRLNCIAVLLTYAMMSD
jgi:tetratricopeptide (TPR) repeat protein